MNESTDATDQFQAALETAGLDSRGQIFVVIMLGISAGTAALGTALLMLANWRSSRRLAEIQSDSEEPRAGQESPRVIGSATGTNDVDVSLNFESHRLTEPKQEKQASRIRDELSKSCQCFPLRSGCA